jgi:hypothetical protein
MCTCCHSSSFAFSPLKLPKLLFLLSKSSNLTFSPICNALIRSVFLLPNDTLAVYFVFFFDSSHHPPVQNWSPEYELPNRSAMRLSATRPVVIAISCNDVRDLASGMQIMLSAMQARMKSRGRFLRRAPGTVLWMWQNDRIPIESKATPMPQQ